MGFPSCPPLSLTIHHLQDTNAFSSPGSSSPNRETENSPRSDENRAQYPHPDGNSPTHFSLGNPTQQLSWLHPVCSTTILAAKGPRHQMQEACPYIEWPLATSEGELTGLSKELLQLQEEMNTALGGVA